MIRRPYLFVMRYVSKEVGYNGLSKAVWHNGLSRKV